jgi:site-specific DNA-methyltransferase (adenine-specific)
MVKPLNIGLEENRIYHMDNRKGMLSIPEKSINLIISDPPYFEVKGDFDFVWKNFDEYLEFMEGQAKLYKRVLAENGSLFVYGHAKRIAYIQVIFDKYFNLENSLVWRKVQCQTMRQDFEQSRCFAPITERILFYSNEIGQTGLEKIKLDVNNFKPLRLYFEKLQKWIGLGLKKINDKLGHRKAEHAFYWKSTQWDLPTKTTYSELIKVFGINKWEGFKEYEALRQEYEALRQEYEALRQEYEALRQEYEALRQEYEALRRPFNNYKKYYDVLDFSQESHITGQYDHETIKPETLTRAMILTCSRKNDIVLVPFSGSGTECAMAAKEKRRFIGFDTDEKHVKTGQDRVRPILENKQTSILDFIE